MPRPLNTELGGTGRNDGQFNYTASGTGAVTRGSNDRQADFYIDAFDFMTEAQIASVKARNNNVDVTSALQAAINAAGDFGRVFLPPGSYKTTSTLTVAYNRIFIEGAGRYATQIYFSPTASGTCLELGAVGSTKTLGGVKGISFYSDDSTYKKVALDCIDISNWIIEDIGINGGVVASSTLFWSGASSIGIRTRGRDTTGVRDIYISADLPVQISVNPNLSSISIDHWNFHNCYLIANANPQVTIDTGVYLTQVSFTGYQAWVLGTSGVKWTDTTSTAVSNGLVLENIRCEQGTDSSQYLVDISHNTALQNLVLRNCTGGVDRKTAKLRKVDNATFDCFFHAGTLEALDADSTVKRIVGINCFWQAGSTATLAGQRLVFGVPKNPSGALPPTFIYDESANASKNTFINTAISQDSFTLANNATLALGSNLGGTLTVVRSDGLSATYALHGSQNTVDLYAGTTSSSFFSATGGTASKVNVYFTGGQYTIQNNSGGSLNFKIALAGSYGAF